MAPSILLLPSVESTLDANAAMESGGSAGLGKSAQRRSTVPAARGSPATQLRITLRQASRKNQPSYQPSQHTSAQSTAG